MIDETPIGVGRTAEVYALDDRRVVKLLYHGFDTGALIAEAAKTQAAHDAGVAAPATHGGVSFDGRFGYVFDRVDGEVMRDVLRGRRWRYRCFATLLASVQADMHTRRSAALPDVKALLAAGIDAALPLDAAWRRAAKDRLLALEDGGSVLHGDLHPGNVILAGGGPVVIDWIDAARGCPAADVARTLWLLSPAATSPATPHRRTVVALHVLFRRSYLRGYAAATGMTAGQLRPWRLPVLSARLSEGIEHETEPILTEIRRLAS